MSTPRIAPGSRRDVGLFTWVFAGIAGRTMRTNPPNLFTTLGRHRGLFRGWLFFASRLMPGGKLARRETELVILRVAHLKSCEYEFEHHRHLGKRAGLGPADIERVVVGPRSAGWSPRERTLLACVDELHSSGDLSDSSWADLRSYLDERRAIEFLLLAGHYSMLATTITTLRIQTDAPRAR